MKGKSDADRRSFIKILGVLGLAGASAPIASSCSSSAKKDRKEIELAIQTRIGYLSP